MKRLIWILPALLLLGIIFITQKNKIPNFLNRNGSQQERPVEPEYEITGILRDMHLDQELKDELKLPAGLYQLERINQEDNEKLPYNVTGIYLENILNNPNGMVGKCVTVKGKVNKQWHNDMADARVKQKKLVFDQIVLDIDLITKKDFSECEGYSKNNDIAGLEAKPKKIFMGIVERALRNSPDVNEKNYYIKSVPESEYVKYQYLNVDESIVAEDITIEPSTNEIWQKIENNMRERIVIEGYEIGEGRDRYILVMRVME